MRVCLHGTNEKQPGRTADFPLLFLSSKDFAGCVKSNCVLVGQTAPFSATMKDFSKLLTIFVDSRVMYHACMACVQ